MSMKVSRIVAFGVAAAMQALAVVGFGTAVAQTASGSRFEGTLSVVWGDPRPGLSGGGTRFSLTTPDGTHYPLDVATDQRNSAIHYFGKRVIVQGNAVSNARGGSNIVVDQIQLAPSSDAVQPQNTMRRRVKRRVLFVLLRFKGDNQEPHPPRFFRDLTNPIQPPAGSKTPATINGFFNKTSWGQLRWRADVVGRGGLNPRRWLTLPKARNQYAPCGGNGSCLDFNGLSDDGLALAEAAGVDLSVYDNINLVLNNDLDCCAYGGGYVYGGKFYGITWMPPWGQEVNVYAHELGHSIGLPHSGWVYYAYDSPWDTMSGRTDARSMQCGSYFSAIANQTQALYCVEPGSGYIAAHKDYLNWIPAANKVVITRKMAKRVRLFANALDLGTGKTMIKVCLRNTPCDGLTAHYLTVEARIRGLQYENGMPGDGVIIHDFQANRALIGGPCIQYPDFVFAVPIDATRRDYDSTNCGPGGRMWPNYALGNAQFLPGQTYKNNGLGISVRVLRKAGLSYIVDVTRSK
jgi:Protein of unknown function (DUF5818)